MTDIKIRYNDKPDVGLYDDCLSVEGLVLERDLIPASDTLTLTVQNIKSQRTLNRYHWHDIETSNYFERRLIGEATAIDVVGETQTLVCLENGEIIETVLVEFNTAVEEEFGARFRYFEARDGFEASLYLILCLTEEQLREIAETAESKLDFAGTIQIGLRGLKGFYQSWHPGLYHINNDFKFYFLPNIEAVENFSDVPEHYGQINQHAYYHKQVSISFELLKTLRVPLTSDEDYSLHYANEENQEPTHSAKLKKLGGFVGLLFSLAFWAFIFYLFATAWGLLDS